MGVKCWAVGKAIARLNAKIGQSNQEKHMWIDPKALALEVARKALVALLIPIVFIAYTMLCIYLGRVTA